MIKISILTLCLFGISYAEEGDWYSRWNSSGNTWYEKWEKTISAVDKLPEGVRIETLGKALGVGTNTGELTGEKKAIFDRAQSLLLANPGHAKYYQDKLESMRAEVLANSVKSSEEIERMRLSGKVVEFGDYDNFRQTVFPVLALLPSSETVAVLGHFLNDPESRDGRYLTGELIPRNDNIPFPPNCGAAYIAITNLGIEKPPGGAKPSRRWYDYDLDEVDAWKAWWNQIKSGKRTYRFSGSPIEYGPDGPASSEVIQRAQRNMKRDEERAAGHKKSSSMIEPASVITQIRKPSSIAAILAACALVAGVVWYFIRARKAA